MHACKDGSQLRENQTDLPYCPGRQSYDIRRVYSIIFGKFPSEWEALGKFRKFNF